MFHSRRAVVPACFVFVVAGFLCSLVKLIAAEKLPKTTALDDYINKPDDSYRWELVSEQNVNGMKLVVIDMVSQSWRTPDDVNRTPWQHWVKLAIPDTIQSDIGLLMIGGGANRKDEQPDGPDDVIIQIAKSTSTVVAELGMVPNQPLIFHQDGQERTEDDLIGYAWDQYIKTGDTTWAPRNAMMKSAVRAMDTITAVMESDTGATGPSTDSLSPAAQSAAGQRGSPVLINELQPSFPS